MRKIVIEYPDAVTEEEAVTYAIGCFNPHQHDYKSTQLGYRQGHGFTFGDGRNAYFYRDCQGNYILQLRQKEGD